jgi:hypothetical protein
MQSTADMRNKVILSLSLSEEKWLQQNVETFGK